MSLTQQIQKTDLVSLFKGFTEITGESSLSAIAERIQSEEFKEQVANIQKLKRGGQTEEANKLKCQLPSFTPAGLFYGKRNKESILAYSGNIVLDFDKIPSKNLEVVFKKIIAAPLTKMCFRSPGGNGLKVIVQSGNSMQNHTESFKELVDMYEWLTDFKIDISGKDISRLCFFSHDPEIYFNPKSNLFLKEILVNNSGANSVQMGTNSFKEIMEFTNQLISYEKGNRNNYIFRFSLNCKRRNIPLRKTVEFSLQEFDLSQDEIKKTVSSAYQYSTQSENTLKVKEQGNVDFWEKGIETLNSIINRKSSEPPVKFLYKGIKAGAFGFVYGPSKSGKTTFCENLGMSMAARLKEYLGSSLEFNSGKVLFISLEEYWQNRTERNQKQGEYVSELFGSDDWKENYIVVNEHVPRQIDTEEQWVEIERMIVNSGASVVFIDSLSRLYQGGIEDSSVAKKVTLRLRELTNRLQITLIVIHHTPKQIGKPLTLDSLAGSRVLGQDADFLIGIGKTKSGRNYIKEVAYRYKQEDADHVWEFGFDDNQWLYVKETLPEWKILKEGDGRKDDTNSDLVLETIQKLCLDNDKKAKTSDLIKELLDSGMMAKQTMYNALKKLVQSGAIEKTGNGVYKVKESN